MREFETSLITESELLRLLEERGVLGEGHSVPACGVHANRCVLMDALLRDLGAMLTVALCAAFPWRGARIDAVVGSGNHDGRLASKVALTLGTLDKVNISSGHAKSRPRGVSIHGKKYSRTSLRGASVLVVQDFVAEVVSGLASVRAVREEGGTVVGVQTIFEHRPPGSERESWRSEADPKYRALVSLDFGVCLPEECPFCAKR